MFLQLLDSQPSKIISCPPKKIQIVCPGNMVTGGTESLHLLASVMQSLRLEASIVYYPFQKTFETPNAYSAYRVKVTRFQDIEDTLTIFPEILLMRALKVSSSVSAIWWLSVDNFLKRKYKNSLLNTIVYLAEVLRGNRPIFINSTLKHLVHFSKAEYDKEFLAARGVSAFNLTGPLNPEFLALRLINSDLYNRKNTILYYPRKGHHAVDRLIKAHPRLSFQPLERLSRRDLIQTFKSSKIFVDFGHHPGRERMTREAAICGCCVITNRRGSARNSVDVPIPERFKLDDQHCLFPDLFADRVYEIFNGFDVISQEYDPYRKIILSELKNLETEIRTLFQI